MLVYKALACCSYKVIEVHNNVENSRGMSVCVSRPFRLCVSRPFRLCVSPGHSVCVCLQAIPLPRLKAILPLVFGRTEDKSSNVRKNAVQLLTTVLAANPFAAKVSFSPWVCPL